MKKLLIFLLLVPTLSFSQECFTVGRVVSRVETQDINEKRIIFGIKQMAEEVLSETKDLLRKRKQQSGKQHSGKQQHHRSKKKK